MPTITHNIIPTVVDLATNNRLVDPHDIDIETDVPWWTAGALFATIHNPTNKVLPLLALAKLDDAYLAIALDPTNPTIVTIDPSQEFKLLSSYRATKAAIRDLKKTQEPLPLLDKNQGAKYKLHKLNAIHQSLLPILLQDNSLHHPATLHVILDDTDNAFKNQHQDWLHVMTLHGNDPNTSIVQANLRPHPQDLPPLAKATLANDLSDLLSTNDHPLLRHLAPLTNPTNTQQRDNHPPTPANTTPDHTQIPPDTPLTDTNTPPLPRLQRNRAHPTNLAGTYTRPQPPRNYKAPTTTPHRRRAPDITPTRSPQLLAQQRLNELLLRDNLTTEDFNQMNTLTSILQTPPTEPNHSSHLLPNLLGWAGLVGDAEQGEQDRRGQSRSLRHPCPENSRAI